MGQEFIIKSPQIEDKINQLLPSQGGFQPGVDFSASTQIIPIVDLTETAEGSALRQDLQTAISFVTANTFDVENTTNTLINTAGYYRIIGSTSILSSGSGQTIASIILNDGTTDKTVWEHSNRTTTENIFQSLFFDFNVFLDSGHSLKIFSSRDTARLSGSVRQIADLQGNLVNP